MSKKIIIIGASAAGIAVLHTLRMLKPDFNLLCISQEKELPYNKCFLADYISGLKQENELAITKVSDNFKHQFLFSTTIMKIDRERKMVIADDGRSFQYDDLFLGMGSFVTRPPIPQINQLDGIFNFQTFSDMHAIERYIEQRNVKNIVIIGAGLSGLECADALLSKNIQSTVIELQEHVLSSLISAEPASFIAQRMQQAGITFLANSTVSSFTSQDNRVTGVSLADSTHIKADMVICATGLRPASALATEVGITTHQGGIVVNELMQTNDPHIYAGGDVIMVKDQLTGILHASCTWPDAMMQGLFAANAIAGKPRVYPGVMTISTSAFFGVKFATYGMKNLPEDATSIIKHGADYYHQFIVQNDILIGFVLIGQTQRLAEIKRALLSRQPISSLNL